MHIKPFALGVLTIGLAFAPMARGDDGAEELIGGYTVVSGEKYGASEPKERIEGTTVRITVDGIIVTTPDKKDAYVSSYKIENSKSPYRITMTSKLAPSEGEVSHGLIEKEGDTVRLIYSLPGAEAPSDFKTKDKQLMFVMKNENKDKKKID